MVRFDARDDLPLAEPRDPAVAEPRQARLLLDLAAGLEPRDRVARAQDGDGGERLERRGRLAEPSLGVLEPPARVGLEDRRVGVDPLAEGAREPGEVEADRAPRSVEILLQYSGARGEAPAGPRRGRRGSSRLEIP